jgi:hypothetical protein
MNLEIIQTLENLELEWEEVLVPVRAKLREEVIKDKNPDLVLL